MNFIEIREITVRRKFRHTVYKQLDGTTAPCLELARDCGIGCTCEAFITKATPGPKLAESKTLCFNDRINQGISEVQGSAKAIKEGPDEWVYEVTAKIVRAQNGEKIL